MSTRFNLGLLFGSRRTSTIGRDTIPKRNDKIGVTNETRGVQLPSMRPSAAMNMRVSRYLIGGYNNVEGWLVPTTAHIMGILAEEQTRLGVRGDLVEIGVHHGKSFLVLANSIASDEKVFAIDVFDDQHKNIDQSGHGNRQMLLDNVNARAPEAPIEIIQESSLDLPFIGWPQSHADSIRFFSIDGSHTREATLNDLKIAEQTTKDGAIVTVDDVLSSHWLGVVSGLFDYFSTGGKLIPFAVIPDKMLLSKGERLKQTWVDIIRREYGKFISKRDVKFLDHSVDIVEENFSLLKELEAQISWAQRMENFGGEGKAPNKSPR